MWEAFSLEDGIAGKFVFERQDWPGEDVVWSQKVEAAEGKKAEGASFSALFTPKLIIIISIIILLL